MERAPYDQHLHILLDETLNFKQHIESDILKIDKGISDKKKKTQTKFPLKSFVTIYKA